MTSRALLRLSSCESLNFPSTMQNAAVISCVFISSLLHTGQFALIETKETVWAAVGDQASLSCRLTEDKDVLQITWQKVLPNGEKNLATYTKKFGSRVSAGVEEKMDFQYESLQSCSMVIRKVMEEDEGCYRCLFNTYPNGALIGKTCLKLNELHGPFITISRSNSPPGSVVTCSATGRPVPMVTLTVLHQNLSFSHYNTSRVTNTNGTITSTTTALLSALSSTQVECSVFVQTAALRELLVTVPGLKDSSDGFDEDFESDDKDERWLVTVAMGLLVFLCGAFGVLSMLWFKKKHQNRSEERQMPEKNNDNNTCVLINRQTSKQQSPTSPTSPTTPDIESCSPEGMRLHQKLTAKKSK
ncbi:OX-2 membrane glycoprotein-like isoform X2 [Poecilia latipinna]|uniref:OX-2 membrane glycoprotein-like isoform X2 n=1 Tax=Poecilia latipinna TaxID=48699 RepID=UPI00072DEB1B|nr:PREDICTED: OX-2 membrane glycoprotein-like isoform X2 [Poecilia latipinna]